MTTMHAIERTTETTDEILAAIAHLLSANAGALFLQDATGRNVLLAPEIVAAFQTVVDSLIENRPSVLYPKRALLTTQQAADYLGVSRPHLIKLLEEGKLPFSTTGTHRRISFEQLASYQASLDELRDKALDEMVRIGEEAGMYQLEEQLAADDSAA